MKNKNLIPKVWGRYAHFLDLSANEGDGRADHALAPTRAHDR